MRVLVVSQFYAPDTSAGTQFLTELCEDLVAGGDEVTVVSSRGTNFGEALPPAEIIRGVRVVRAWSTSFGKSSIPGRLSDYATFFASSAASALVQAPADVMLTVTTPPMIALTAGLVARSRGIPLVTWVQDVYPEVAVELGVMRAGGPAFQAFARLQRASHHLSDRIVAISGGMRERLVAQGAHRERVEVIHNWSDGSLVRPRAATESAFRKRHGLEGRFVVMYSGNLGIAHDIATLIDAARIVGASHPSVLFVFVGDGGRRAEAERRAQGLENVRFLPHQPRETLGESLSAADAHLICLREGLEGLIVPSKLYGALASGTPVLYVGPEDCEITKVVRDHAVGWAGRPGDAEGLASAVVELRVSTAPPLAGRRARALFEQKHDRTIAVTAWRELLGRHRRR